MHFIYTNRPATQSGAKLACSPAVVSEIHLRCPSNNLTISHVSFNFIVRKNFDALSFLIGLFRIGIGESSAAPID